MDGWAVGGSEIFISHISQEQRERDSLFSLVSPWSYFLHLRCSSKLTSPEAFYTRNNGVILVDLYSLSIFTLFQVRMTMLQHLFSHTFLTVMKEKATAFSLEFVCVCEFLLLLIVFDSLYFPYSLTNWQHLFII